MNGAQFATENYRVGISKKVPVRFHPFILSFFLDDDSQKKYVFCWKVLATLFTALKF